MKKTTLSVVAMATSCFAYAQSSVTLFGTVDAVLQRVNNSGGASVTRLHNSGYQNSKIGFRGAEDLGGGLSATFWLEAGINNDNGTGLTTNTNNQASGAGTGPANGGQGLVFNRRATVSLAGPMGEVRLGRDYTPQFWNITIFDPFGSNGAGTTLTSASIVTGVTSIRASNTVGYLLPSNLGGLYGQFQYYFGENPSNTATKNDGTGYGARVGYAFGPLDVAIAIGRTKYLNANVRQDNVGAQWNFGAARLMGQVTSDANGPIKARGALIGMIVPIGSGEIRVSTSRYRSDVGPGPDPTNGKFALGYVHHLSKRTALYTTFAKVRNTNGSNASAVPGAAGNPLVNGQSTGYDFGIRHSF